jgi:hypothetical protein
LGFGEGQRASVAAIPAVWALVVSLPLRLRRQWGEPHPWRSLGVVGPGPAVLQALLRGLIKAAALLALVVIGLQLAGALIWPLHTSAAVLLNGLVLALGVGFAEELLFRGWLLGELELKLGSQRALWLQAALFSLVHTRFNLPLLVAGGRPENATRTPTGSFARAAAAARGQKGCARSAAPSASAAAARAAGGSAGLEAMRARQQSAPRRAASATALRL